MSIARRDFLRTGVAAAAVSAATSGCNHVSFRPPPKPAGGWDQLPEILARIVPPQFPARDFVVTDYGAAGDGSTDCCPAFAAAIAACHKAGGGRVVVPAARNVYLCNGPIHLLSNVNLHLAQGTVVRFGFDPAFYLPAVLIRYQGIRCYNYSPLIYANGQTNIAITGSGSFDGQAYHWLDYAARADSDWALLQQMVANGVPVERRIFGPGHNLRLTLFEPYGCQNVLVEGVTFMASPFWTLHPCFCTNVTFRDVNVLPGQTNDDGCDPDSCTDVLVDGCTFNTHDDNFSLKAGAGSDAIGLAPCQNVVIQNCRTIQSLWGGLTIGSDTGSIVEGVFVQDCQFGPCDYAFYFKSSSAVGGAVKSVFIRSCNVSSCEQFFTIASAYNNLQGSMPPLFENINLQNVNCGAAQRCAFAILGDSRNPIVYLSLADIAIGPSRVVEAMENAFFVSSSNVTVGGRPVTIRGVL